MQVLTFHSTEEEEKTEIFFQKNQIICDTPIKQNSFLIGFFFVRFSRDFYRRGAEKST
jgi:hypothetical protein